MLSRTNLKITMDNAAKAPKMEIIAPDHEYNLETEIKFNPHPIFDNFPCWSETSLSPISASYLVFPCIFCVFECFSQYDIRFMGFITELWTLMFIDNCKWRLVSQEGSTCSSLQCSHNARTSFASYCYCCSKTCLKLV